MGQQLEKLSIRGFKSIESLNDFALGRLTVMIGANGAGKSNFVDFFRMLRAVANEDLQGFIRQGGGADGFFFLGPKRTNQITARLQFGENVYEFELKPAAGGTLFVSEERVKYTGGTGKGEFDYIGKGNLESQLKARRNDQAYSGKGKGVSWYVYDAISSWMAYHFNDTSFLAGVRRPQEVQDKAQLGPEAGNIAPFLLGLQERHGNQYGFLLDTIRLVAPYFDDFDLQPESNGNAEMVELKWRQKGSDFPFRAYQFSDGTLRFICLATALLQPRPPSTMIIDEPELGLHPYAIALLADLIKSAAKHTQVIVATQSPILLDHFGPEEIVVVSRREGQSVFERLDPEMLREWLDEYSLGELWQKNVVRGGPTHE